MTNSCRTSIVTAAAVLSVALLVPRPAAAQLPRDPVERAKIIAQIFQANARQLTVYDREGNQLNQVGPRDMYNQPILSPDTKRVVVVKVDLDKETNDLWVLDAETGKGVQITFRVKRQRSAT